MKCSAKNIETGEPCKNSGFYGFKGLDGVFCRRHHMYLKRTLIDLDFYKEKLDMTSTPRVRAVLSKMGKHTSTGQCITKLKKLARTLERELNVANDEIKRLKMK